MDPENNRRNFLRFGFTLASGILTPVSLNSCRRDERENGGSRPQQTFVQPAMLEAKDGLLDLTLTASYFDTKLSGSNPSRQYAVSLRAYGYDANGPNYCGPSLVVRGGDQLRIELINQLPVNPPFVAFRDPTNYMKPNTTNLHTHGLHVFPGIYSEKNPLEYGDYVVDPNTGGVIPQGGARQYVYNLPLNHPAGPFYYHPQYHGSSALQVASLMAGAILVRGPVDDLPEMAQANELIFLFQGPYFAKNEAVDNYGVKKSTLEKFSQIANHPTGDGIKRSDMNHNDLAAAPVLINGVRQPTIVMESGEVQRWRFINTQVFNCLNLNLDGHTLQQYTSDGWGSIAYQDYPDARQKGGRGIVLSAGNRSSVIVKAGAPGTYLLRSLPISIAQGAQIAVLSGDILAKVIVIEAAKASKQKKSTAIPAVPLPISEFLKPITDEEFANAGGKKRSIIFNMLGNDVLGPSADAQSIWKSAYFALTTPNPIPSYEYQLQPSNTITQNVILGAVEEWTIFNCNSISHPFHIHVNPMYVTKINGNSIQPYWCDTIALPSGGTPGQPKSITFRMRFVSFTGPYLMHCQMLHHSDLGMIQHVTVVPV